MAFSNKQSTNLIKYFIVGVYYLRQTRYLAFITFFHGNILNFIQRKKYFARFIIHLLHSDVNIDMIVQKCIVSYRWLPREKHLSVIQIINEITKLFSFRRYEYNDHIIRKHATVCNHVSAFIPFAYLNPFIHNNAVN